MFTIHSDPIEFALFCQQNLLYVINPKQHDMIRSVTFIDGKRAHLIRQFVFVNIFVVGH